MPNQSHNFNPIQNLSKIINNWVIKRHFTNLRELERICIEKWTNVILIHAKNLYKLIKKLLQAIIPNKGGYNKILK